MYDQKRVGNAYLFCFSNCFLDRDRALSAQIRLITRIKKLQRFLSLPQFQINSLWFPIVQAWIEGEFGYGEILDLVIDGSQWRSINLLMVSLVL
jgi:hypothetical protein